MTQTQKAIFVAVLSAGLSMGSLAQTEGQSGDTTGVPSPASTKDADIQGRETYEAETNPLSGSQIFGLGMSGESLNMLNVGFSIHEQADSNMFASGTGSDFRSVTTILGNIDLNRMWKRNSLNLHYTGGGSIYAEDSDFNNMSHDLGFVQSLSWQRWTLRFGDDLSYSPYAPFGIGIGGLGIGPWYGNGDLVLHPGEIPDQSIFSNRSSRLGNTVFSNLDYSFTRRTALSLNGSYGLLRFKDAEFYDSEQYGAGIGVSHQLNGHDSISVNYRFNRNQYDLVTTSFETHTAELRYGRRITGRMALELWGGPELNYYEQLGVTRRNVYGSGGVSLRYQTRATEYWAGYNRGVRSGSGILLGSVADNASAGAGRNFGRNWSGNLSGGYSRNEGLTVDSEFNSFWGGASIRRAIGRSSGISANYTLQRQTAACGVAVNCAVYTRQLVGVSFDWHMRPIKLGE